MYVRNQPIYCGQSRQVPVTSRWADGRTRDCDESNSLCPCSLEKESCPLHDTFPPGMSGIGQELCAIPTEKRRTAAYSHPWNNGLLCRERVASWDQVERVGGAWRGRAEKVFSGIPCAVLYRGLHGELGRHRPRSAFTQTFFSTIKINLRQSSTTAVCFLGLLWETKAGLCECVV